MSNEQYEKTDIDKGRRPEQRANTYDYGNDDDALMTSSPVIIRKTNRLEKQALTIADIQDEKDRNDRLKLIKHNSKLRSSDGKKGKRKRKLIEYDYGKEDDELETNKKVISQILKPGEKVQYIGDNSVRISKTGSPAFDYCDYTGTVENKKQICSLILENFDNLNMIELFSGEANILLQLHLFHLYIYSIVHDQDKNFLETDNSFFKPETFVKILAQLLQVKELNNNFNSKFVLGEYVNKKKNTGKKSIEKIEVPPIISKRLDIASEN
mmetsp:Transcript_5651/g.7165  ORF Transcript_5651/g.7165 Transcript_5651/m.7165 type:complete len:268 (+) Transcript_5651:5209-6012(+)